MVIAILVIIGGLLGALLADALSSFLYKGI